MKLHQSIILLFLGAFVEVIFSSCKHGYGGQGGTSAHNKEESHNMGLNCMNCHSGTGEGQGCFAVAGTVYNQTFSKTKSNPTIQMYTQADGKGDLIKIIDGDDLGNFYNENSSGLTGSFYPVVVSSDGKVQKMLEPISTGACNSCHGVKTDKIWVD